MKDRAQKINAEYNFTFNEDGFQTTLVSFIK